MLTALKRTAVKINQVSSLGCQVTWVVQHNHFATRRHEDLTYGTEIACLMIRVCTVLYVERDCLGIKLTVKYSSVGTVPWTLVLLSESVSFGHGDRCRHFSQCQAAPGQHHLDHYLQQCFNKNTSKGCSQVLHSGNLARHLFFHWEFLGIKLHANLSNTDVLFKFFNQWQSDTSPGGVLNRNWVGGFGWLN